MEHAEIFSATLGIFHPWQVTAVEIHGDGKQLKITVDFANDGNFCCPMCGTNMKCCGSTHETWHHSDFFRHETHLIARVPQINCATCGVQPVERPWSRAGSRFLQLTDQVQTVN